MKFCKKYQEYMQGQEKELPGVEFKKHKKILKKCRSDLHSHNHPDAVLNIPTCPHCCPVCDGTFFPSLLNEMSAVVGCFNERAQKLLDLHLATGFRKYFIWCKGKVQGNHVALIQEGKDLVTYAMIHAIAIRKILKKYDKIHYSKQGQAFKSQAQSMHIEILQSPWLCELMAFHINLRETSVKRQKAPSLFEGCALILKDDKPSLSCELFDSIKLDIDLTCSICLVSSTIFIFLFFSYQGIPLAYHVYSLCIMLVTPQLSIEHGYDGYPFDTVFDPVSLTCGHIFCYMCACSAASVTVIDGLKVAEPREKCPLCREAGVYEGAVHLEELNILLSRSCREYWETRLQTERTERIQQAKEHWETQCRAFMGV